jgi:hypothetical protein
VRVTGLRFSTEWEEKGEGYSPAPDASASPFEASSMTGMNQGSKIRYNDQDTRDQTNFKFQDTRRGRRRKAWVIFEL